MVKICLFGILKFFQKNEWNNSIIVLLVGLTVRQKKRIRSFVFWKNRRLEKNITTLSDLYYIRINKQIQFQEKIILDPWIQNSWNYLMILSRRLKNRPKFTNDMNDAKHYFLINLKFIYSEKATKFCEIFP